MPELKWDETDVMYCLEVFPEVSAHGNEFVYTVEKDGLVLELVIHPFESIVAVSLAQVGATAPLMKLELGVRCGVLYGKDKIGEFLDLEDCFFLKPDGNSWEATGHPDVRGGEGHLIRIRIKPAIHLTLNDYFPYVYENWQQPTPAPKNTLPVKILKSLLGRKGNG